MLHYSIWNIGLGWKHEFMFFYEEKDEKKDENKMKRWKKRWKKDEKRWKKDEKKMKKRWKKDEKRRKWVCIFQHENKSFQKYMN